MEINIKRVYATWSEEDGFRVLVDRLWPRGLIKDKARLDLWHKDIAPSSELRKWFHREQDWLEFKRRYLSELAARPKNRGSTTAPISGLPAATNSGPTSMETKA